MKTVEEKLLYHREYTKEYRRMKKKFGICVNCNNKAEEERTMCIKCLIAHRERSKKRRLKLKNEQSKILENK